MKLRFRKGDKVIFHCVWKGERKPRVVGEALEDGETSVAARFRVRIKPGVVRIPGKSIYGVMRST